MTDLVDNAWHVVGVVDRRQRARAEQATLAFLEMRSQTESRWPRCITPMGSERKE